MRWSVCGVLSASTHSVTVEADDKESAIEKAMSLIDHMPSICHQCSREVELGEVYEYDAYEVDAQPAGAVQHD